MSGYTIGSLFDGSGGFPLAAAMCGGTPVWAAEVEPYPIAVTRSRFPKMIHLGDVSKINGAEVQPVDVVTFGSPCQDLSIAGKRAGLKHKEHGDQETTRSGMFMEAVRIIKEMRYATDGKYPAFAIWENVPGAFSSHGGEDFRIVLEELIKIVEPAAEMPPISCGGWPYSDVYMGDGWSLAYRVFDAQYWGVPQRRRRIHAVLDLRGVRAKDILFEREGLRGYFAEGSSPWKAAARDAEGCPAQHDSILECGVKCLNPWDAQSIRQYDISGVSPTLNAGSSGGQNRSGVVIPVSAGFKAGQSMAGSLGYQEERAATLSAESGGLEPTVCYKIQLYENHGQDARYKGPLNVCPMLPAQLGTGGNNTPFVVEECIPINDKATRYKGGGSTRNGDGSGNGLGIGKNDDPAPTLTSCDRHAVCYCIGNGQAHQLELSEQAGALNCMHDQQVVLTGTFQNTGIGYWKESEVGATLRCPNGSGSLEANLVAGIDCRNIAESPELYPTLQAKPNGGQSLNFSGAVRIKYIVRRLTETECARLQGFADTWGIPDAKPDMSDEEYRFWLEVRNTHEAITGKAVKAYKKPQIVKWYNKLHTASAEYKMWGNGIALPPALYVFQGIQDAFERSDAE